MTRISIIVPVYNVENLLERCVDSILAQTRNDLDVILVDDGSTDASGPVCDIYAEYFPRVRAFHTPNRGLAAARNFGIERACEAGSELIGFVDSDDFVYPQMYEKLASAMDRSGADMAYCGTHRQNGGSAVVLQPAQAVLGRDEALRGVFSHTIGNVVWNKLFKAGLFEGVRFPEGHVYEDKATTYLLIARCGSVVTIPYVGYCHMGRPDSISRTYTLDNLSDFWIFTKAQFEFFDGGGAGPLDAEAAGLLARDLAEPISRMWKWAFAGSRDERRRLGPQLHEMQEFEREHLRHVDKSGWPLSLKAPLLLSRSQSELSFAAGYLTTQAVLRARAVKKALSPRA